MLNLEKTVKLYSKLLINNNYKVRGKGANEQLSEGILYFIAMRSNF